MAYLREQLRSDNSAGGRLIVANNLFKLAVAKGIAVGILGFGYTVGVKQEAVAWADWHRTNRDSRRTPVSLQKAGHCFRCAPAYLAASAEAVDVRRRNTAPAPFSDIKPQIGRRDELTAQLPGKDAVQPAQHCLWVMCARPTDCMATLIIDAISAAGTPCPETSATRKPTRF